MEMPLLIISLHRFHAGSCRRHGSASQQVYRCSRRKSFLHRAGQRVITGRSGAQRESERIGDGISSPVPSNIRRCWRPCGNWNGMVMRLPGSCRMRPVRFRHPQWRLRFGGIRSSSVSCMRTTRRAGFSRSGRSETLPDDTGFCFTRMRCRRMGRFLSPHRRMALTC